MHKLLLVLAIVFLVALVLPYFGINLASIVGIAPTSQNGQSGRPLFTAVSPERRTTSREQGDTRPLAEIEGLLGSHQR